MPEKYRVNYDGDISELNGKTVFFNIMTEGGPFSGIGKFDARNTALGNTLIDIKVPIFQHPFAQIQRFCLTQNEVDLIQKANSPQWDYTIRGDSKIADR